MASILEFAGVHYFTKVAFTNTDHHRYYLSQIGSGEPFGNDSLELSSEDDVEKEEVDDDDDDDEDGDWEDEGGWLPSGGNNTRHENPKNDMYLIKDVPYFLRKYKVRFGLATGLHFQSGLTLLKLFTLGRLICLIQGEKLICNNCVKLSNTFHWLI